MWSLFCIYAERREKSKLILAALALLVIEQAHDSAGIKWESTSGLSLDTLACHSRLRAGISFLSSSTEGRGFSAYSGLIVDIIQLGLSKKDNLFWIKIVFMLYIKFKTSL